MRKILTSAVMGLLAFFVVNLCSGFTGVTLVPGAVNLIVAAVLGIPGVITITVFHYLIR